MGSGERIPPAAPDQSAAPGLDREHRAACGQQGAGRRLRRRHPGRRHGAQGRRGAGHRPGRPRRSRWRSCTRWRRRRPNVQYREVSAEALAAEQPGQFDVVTCMEMLEHVPDPASVVQACAALVKPGGWVFFSTINRNAKAFLFAIVGAEYVLNMLPRGTHEYAQVHPPERAGRRIAAQRGLDLRQTRGLRIQPADPPLLARAATPASTTCSPRASRQQAHDVRHDIRGRAVRPGRHPDRQRARPGRGRRPDAHGPRACRRLPLDATGRWRARARAACWASRSASTPGRPGFAALREEFFVNYEAPHDRSAPASSTAWPS